MAEKEQKKDIITKIGDFAEQIASGGIEIILTPGKEEKEKGEKGE